MERTKPRRSDATGPLDRVPPARVPLPAMPAEGVVHQSPRLLLVEDDAGDALLVEELVADCRPTMTLHWVTSLAAAREAVSLDKFDCVLLDLHLPDGGGMDALRSIQTWTEGTAIVVLTGMAEEESGLEAVAVGAQDYLVKGRVDPEWLGRAVRYAVQRKQTEQAAVALRASLLQAQENARLERGLLPRPLLREDPVVDVITRYLPGRSQALLGGDFYDVVQTEDGTVHVLIGDVSGHGPDEAALGVALRIAWRTLVLSDVDFTRRVHRLEQILVAERSRDHIFATLTYLSIAPDATHARVVRAGHPAMFLKVGETVELWEVPAGPALGLLPEPRWPVEVVQLPDRDWSLMLFTDGLFEGRIGAAGERLEEEGLLEMARAADDDEPHLFLDALISNVQARAEPHGGLVDDVAVVHVRRRGIG